MISQRSDRLLLRRASHHTWILNCPSDEEHASHLPLLNHGPLVAVLLHQEILEERPSYPRALCELCGSDWILSSEMVLCIDRESSNHLDW